MLHLPARRSRPREQDQNRRLMFRESRKYAVRVRTAVSSAPGRPTGPPHGFNAMIGQKATRPVSDFGEFFRTAYQPLVGQVIIFAGGNLDEAQDAVSDAMTEILQRWDEIRNPRAYAYRAAVSNLIKYKQRGLARIRERQIERGAVVPGQDLDSDPTVWEQQEWVKMLLNSLPSAQREVLACTFDMFTPREIAQLLGKTEAAVRQNLCAARKRLACYLAEAGREEGGR